MCLNAGGQQRLDAESETLIPTIGGVFSAHGFGDFFCNQSVDAGHPVPVAWTGDGVTADPISANEGRTYTHEGINFRLHNCVQQPVKVRRLTPVECERLQGFPDGYTAIPWRKKTASECPDGPRYKALGNSWAVPVVRWIGARINAYLSVKEAA
jgi:site-specific DNA-cytosine methylase